VQAVPPERCRSSTIPNRGRLYAHGAAQIRRGQTTYQDRTSARRDFRPTGQTPRHTLGPDGDGSRGRDPSPGWTALALTATLVTRVERMGVPIFYKEYLFHGATEGADGDSDQLEALDFSGRVNYG
jgi:hypothetical protein